MITNRCLGDPGEDDQDNEERRRLRRSGDDDRQDEGEDDDDEFIKHNGISDKQPATDRVTRLKLEPQKMDEYDPSTDGERSGISGSRTPGRRK